MDGALKLNNVCTGNLTAGTFLAISRQPLELESCSNPVRILEVFYSFDFKNIF